VVSRRLELAPGVDALVLRCMAKQAADRYQTATELAEAIAALSRHVEEAEAAASPSEAPAEPEHPPGADVWGDGTATEVWPSGLVANAEELTRRSQALDELACALRDRALGSPEISAVLARKLQAEDRVFEAESRIAQLERDVLEAEFRARERESRLRQALSQLEHERRAALRASAATESATSALRHARTLIGGFGAGTAMLEENALAVAQTIQNVEHEMEQRVAELNQQMEPQRAALAEARAEVDALRTELVGLVRGVPAQQLDDELRALCAEAGIC
jgi:hypothetical protein